VNAFFEAAYLRQVRSPVLQPKQQLIVWRSGACNLKYPEGRCQTIKAAIALLHFFYQHLRGESQKRSDFWAAVKR